METTRRDFVHLTAVAGGALGLGLGRQPWTPTTREARRAQTILILGGTGFIGPHMVRAAMEGGHTVTLFNRGRTNTHLFPDVEKLVGDREDNLEALRGRSWDVVIDNSAVVNPLWVRASAGLLSDSVGRYIFTSTRSVYADFTEIGMNETSRVWDPDITVYESGDRLPYGPSKVLCEREANAALPGRTLVVRPGLIVGPGDRTDRFTYWPVRIDRGGEVLAPGDPSNPVMFIDVRDLAEWYMHLIDIEAVGILNALGPEAPLTFAELLYGCRAVTSADVSFTWVDTDFLLEREVRPYADMPMWRPARGNAAGFQRFDLTRPLEAGIKYRPLAVTARDTLEYHYSRPADERENLRAGITAAREAELLREWHLEAG